MSIFHTKEWRFVIQGFVLEPKELNSLRSAIDKLEAEVYRKKIRPIKSDNDYIAVQVELESLWGKDMTEEQADRFFVLNTLANEYRRAH
jgi:hypothetical protein